MPVGRKTKPTNLKILEGNPGKRPLPKDEPRPAGGAPACPEWLCSLAKQEWERIAPQLEVLGLLTPVDMVALAGYCEFYAEFKIAREFVHKHGTTYEAWERNEAGEPIYDDEGRKVLRYSHKYPQVSVAHQAFQQIRSLCSEFGLTPSARGRIQVPGINDAEDVMEVLLQKTKKC